MAATKTEIIELNIPTYAELDEEFGSKESYLKGIFGPDLNLLETGLTFRERVQRLLTSNKFHIMVIALVLIDTVCVAGELIISLENKNDNKALDITESVFKYLGTIILGVFLVEIIFKVAFNTHHFIHSKLEIFDGVIVTVSFILDVYFFEDNAATALGLITILRLWRIARIVNGTIMTIKNRAEAKEKRLREIIDKLKADNQRLASEIAKKEDLIKKLQN